MTLCNLFEVEWDDDVMWCLQMNVTKGAFSDTGNLELYSCTPVWQSFDHPTDTLLPGQRFNSTANVKIYPWRKAGQDWAPGLYALQFSNDSYYLQAVWSCPYIACDPLEDYWHAGTESVMLSAVVLQSDGTFRSPVQAKRPRLAWAAILHRVIIVSSSEG